MRYKLREERSRSAFDLLIARFNEDGFNLNYWFEPVKDRVTPIQAADTFDTTPQEEPDIFERVNRAQVEEEPKECGPIIDWEYVNEIETSAHALGDRVAKEFNNIYRILNELKK